MNESTRLKLVVLCADYNNEEITLEQLGKKIKDLIADATKRKPYKHY